MSPHPFSGGVRSFLEAPAVGESLQSAVQGVGLAGKTLTEARAGHLLQAAEVPVRLVGEAEVSPTRATQDKKERARRAMLTLPLAAANSTQAAR